MEVKSKRGRQRQSIDHLIHQAYYTPVNRGSYGGREQLSKHLKTKKISNGQVKNWLQAQEAYTLHRPVRRKFRRRETLVGGINQQFQADLIDVQKFASENNGNKFILTVVDVFSKFAWTQPLKSKSGKDVANALKKIFDIRICKYLQSDKGKEFYNTHVKALLQKLSITHFSTENDNIKAAIVERFNRSLQTKLSRWFTRTKSHKWVKVLQDLTNSYNRSTHRSIRMAPADVNEHNSEDVWLNLYGNLQSPQPTSDLKVNDVVRVSKYKHIFSKGYDKNWSTETFAVDELLKTNPITFRLRDQMNERIFGSYYRQELQKVKMPTEFLIEKILQEQKVGKKTRYFVKYKGYPNKFNEWIDSSQLV